MKENKFQASIIKTLKEVFPGCVVLKTDASYIQGFPDLLILFRNKWAALECKREGDSPRRPNQDYYIDALDMMSYARFICPENKQEVFDGLQQTFRPGGKARIS